MDPTHHIYVDYENVQNIRLPLIAGKPVTVTLVLGSQQNSLPVDLTTGLMEYSRTRQVRLVQTRASGKNALDFVLACELGGMCARHPRDAYHIISKDKGFDATVEHLRSHRIQVMRHESFAAVPVIAPPVPPAPARHPIPPTLEERVALILDKLQRQPGGRPARTKTLHSSTHAFFGRELKETEIQAIVNWLVDHKKVSISSTGAVTYTI